MINVTNKKSSAYEAVKQKQRNGSFDRSSFKILRQQFHVHAYEALQQKDSSRLFN
jgi:protein-tyrosine phosphatase